MGVKNTEICPKCDISYNDNFKVDIVENSEKMYIVNPFEDYHLEKLLVIIFC